jgi:hypothetical protein
MSVETHAHAQFVRRVLLGNATFGIVTGLIALLWSGALSAAFGLAQPMVLIGLGEALLLFAAALIWIALRMPTNQRILGTIFALDVAWVIASALVLLAGWAPLTAAATWAIIGVADVVALFALLEYIGLRRLRSTAAVGV